MTSTKELSISRLLNAPRELVWKAWAKAEHMQHWWGPKGSKISIKKFDFRPGGIFHYNMEMSGQIMWGRFIYKEIVEPEKIIFISSFSDENGGISNAPFLNNFPSEIRNIVTLAEKEGATLLTLSGWPLNASDEQIKVYNDLFPSMNQGFKGTFDQLEEYLTKL
jgi:uncharacterized protein YndB with AHSA1/START domain